VQPAATIKPSGWLTSTFLFGIPALVFALLFHVIGARLWYEGISWLSIFHLLLILPLALMLIAALVGAAFDVGSLSCGAILQRLRLSSPTFTTWLWAAALSGFMYGGNRGDVVALLASWLALWKERTSRWTFILVAAALVVKRQASLFEPILRSVRFFDVGGFHGAFFSHFGPQDFMGLPLKGGWWIPIYYAVVMLIFNIGGEELWWRGYVLPRQELAFGRVTWLIHGVLWSVFHLFMQPSLWHTVRMAITGIALSFIAQRTKSTWPTIVGHSFGNLPFFLQLAKGVPFH